MSDPLFCDVCGEPADPACTTSVWDDPWDEAPDVIAYCSPTCAEADAASDWAPEPCPRCDRLIRQAHSAIDRRDPRSANFVIPPDDPDGWPICLRCAGLPRLDLTADLVAF